MTTITGRKIRGDAKLEHLNEAQREQLHFWLEESCTYAEAVYLLREKLWIRVGRSTVCAYWRKHILPLQQEDEVEVRATLAALPTGDFDAATLQRAKVLAFSALARIDPNLDAAAKLSGMIHKTERRALAVEKLGLEKRKVAVKERAEERAAKAERRRADAEVRTTKHTKRHERCERSAVAAGDGEGAEVAAKAQSGESLSEGTEEEVIHPAAMAKPAAPSLTRLPDDEAALVNEIENALGRYEMTLEEVRYKADEVERLGEIASAVHADLIRWRAQPGFARLRHIRASDALAAAGRAPQAAFPTVSGEAPGGENST